MDLRALLPASAAGVFALFLLWKLRPRIVVGRRALDPRIGELRAKARSTTGAERAAALVEAGQLAHAGGRDDTAFGLYLRAARADLSATAPIVGLATALSRRRRSLDRVLWHHLAALDPSLHRAAIAATLDALATLQRRDPRRAAALAKLASMARP